jgi:kinesin family member C1
MMGRPDSPDLKGMIPLSLEQIFQTSQSLKDQGWNYKMQVGVLYSHFHVDMLSHKWKLNLIFIFILLGISIGNI